MGIVQQAVVPTRNIGPFKINGSFCKETEDILVPMSTFEAPLWYSVRRGAKISRLICGGITTAILKEVMTRSILLEVVDIKFAREFVVHLVHQEIETLKLVAESTSKYLTFQDITTQLIGRELFLRISAYTEEASGHNMITLAADKVAAYLCEKYSGKLKYVSVSGNMCCDKKVSAVNGLLGRGKYVVAELIIPNGMCERYLNTTCEKIHEINQKKNLLGSIAAGSILSANAHYANILAAIYLSTGQDVANIIEGSQGITSTLLQGQNLVISATLPNIIVGVTGNGKHFPFAKENLKLLGCLNSDGAPTGTGSSRLAEIVAAAVLAGELSLLAALTNQGELIASHLSIERRNTQQL